MEGETHTISLILEGPNNDYLKILVNLESLKGIWERDWLVRADIQWPSFDRLPLMDFNSANLIYLSSDDISFGILNFSEPARSIILN